MALAETLHHGAAKTWSFTVEGDITLIRWLDIDPSLENARARECTCIFQTHSSYSEEKSSPKHFTVITNTIFLMFHHSTLFLDYSYNWECLCASASLFGLLSQSKSVSDSFVYDSSRCHEAPREAHWDVQVISVSRPHCSNESQWMSALRRRQSNTNYYKGSFQQNPAA